MAQSSPATRYAAFLRGINVGHAKRIAMADLRTLFTDVGYTDVRTVLNSGNVVFTALRPPTGADVSRIERTILGDLGVATQVIVLPARELATAVRECPFGADAHDPSRLLLLVFRDKAARAALAPLLTQDWDPEALALGRRVAYLWCAHGIATSPLRTAANRRVGDAGTARNVTTMARLVASP
jgi:uncharacterized protein (DUF1697 family)